MLGMDGFGREGSRGQKRAEGGGGERGWEEKGKKDWGGGGGSERKEVGCSEKESISKNIENYSDVV